MSITYTFIGHATHLFEFAGKRVLIDPYFHNNPVTDITPDQVKAEYIMITHGHYDHIEDALETIQATGAKVITNLEISGWLQRNGIPAEQMHAQYIGGGHAHDFGHVTFTMAQHGSGLPDGSDGGNPVGFLIEADGKRIYIVGDSGYFSDMAHYGEQTVDLMLVPIGDNFTMGPDAALRAVKAVSPKLVMPCHYDTWPLIAQDAAAWAKRVEAKTDARVQMMAPGDQLTL